MRPQECDACEDGRATHNIKDPNGEGSFCCDCAHCADPGCCAAEFEDEDDGVPSYGTDELEADR